jgi:hypothetical protein
MNERELRTQRAVLAERVQRASEFIAGERQRYASASATSRIDLAQFPNWVNFAPPFPNFPNFPNYGGAVLPYPGVPAPTYPMPPPFSNFPNFPNYYGRFGR